MKPIARLLASLPLFLCLAGSLARGQGALTPPGPPAPIMKSLDQVASTGTAINGTNTPGNASAVYAVGAPGAYFLTGNLMAPANKNGIIINSDDVTIELNGFAIISGATGQSALSGIGESAAHKNIAIRNGTVRGWGQGDITVLSTNVELSHLRVSDCQGTSGVFTSGDGINARGANDLVIADCVATNNAGDGFALQSSGAVTNCVASQNKLSGYSGANITFNNCVADSNVAAGFFLFSGCHLGHCAATNSATGSQATGFFIGTATSATDCVAYGNKGPGFNDSGASSYFNCVAAFNAQGMLIGSGSIVTHCNMFQCAGIGFEFGSNCLLTNDSAEGNGGAGFKSDGSLNRIDSNTAVRNGGIGFIWGNDYLVRNTSFANTSVNYSPTPGGGNSGPIQTASNATNAWANF